MDYEKEYKDALARMELCVRTGLKITPEYIFPELADSGDERIRKYLIEELKALKSVGELKFSIPAPTKEECIVYLEKQKVTAAIPDELVECYKNLCERGNRWVALLINAINGVNEQKEQIPYIDFVIKPHKGDANNPYDMSVSEAQEYAIKRGFGIPFNDGEVYVDERHLTQTIGNILRWADEHPKEHKPEERFEEARKKYQVAWSEEEKDKLKSIERLIVNANAHGNYLIGDKEAIELQHFIRSIVKPTTNLAEWSEEDESKMGVIIRLVEQNSGWPYRAIKEYVNWLKSLRPSWKPNEEQMEALERTTHLSNFGLESNRRQILLSLYEQLKKLM